MSDDILSQDDVYIKYIDDFKHLSTICITKNDFIEKYPFALETYNRAERRKLSRDSKKHLVKGLRP